MSAARGLHPKRDKKMSPYYTGIVLTKYSTAPGKMVVAYNHSTLKAEAGKSLQVGEHPELYKKTVSTNKCSKLKYVQLQHLGSEMDLGDDQSCLVC